MDIICLQETFLKENGKINIKNFEAIITYITPDWGLGGGGVNLNYKWYTTKQNWPEHQSTNNCY